MTNREVELLSRLPVSAKSGDVKEGFQDGGSSQATTQSKNKSKPQQAGGLEGSVTGFATYIMDVIGSYIGPDVVTNWQTTLTDENNMVPIGFVLILMSILLYFIDVSS
jgi:hypothetical protein